MTFCDSGFDYPSSRIGRESNLPAWVAGMSWTGRDDPGKDDHFYLSLKVYD